MAAQSLINAKKLGTPTGTEYAQSKRSPLTGGNLPLTGIRLKRKRSDYSVAGFFSPMGIRMALGLKTAIVADIDLLESTG